MKMKYRNLLSIMIVLVWNHLSQGHPSANISAMCGSDEMCVSKQLCDQSAEFGFGGPRVVNICNVDMICCDREQLEKWNATQSHIQSRYKRESTSTETPSGYESCGENMDCVPRRLCEENVANDDGRFIVKPILVNSTCKNVLYRCCHRSNQSLL